MGAPLGNLNAVANNGGSPTKYREEFCEKVKAHLSQGFSLGSAGSVCGTHQDTLFTWMNVHIEFRRAVKDGRSAGMELWEQRLTNQALTNPGNTAAIIFAMKNLYRDNWMDRVEQVHVGANGGPIQQETAVNVTHDVVKTIANRMNEDI